MKNFILWLGCYFGNLLFFILVDYLMDLFVFGNEPSVKNNLFLNMIMALIFSIQTFFFILERREKKAVKNQVN